MDLVDVAVLAKNAKSLAKQTVSNSAVENRHFLASTVEHAGQKGVKILHKTQFGENILEGGKFLEKTATKGVKIVGKTQLGGAVLEGGKFVGGAALNVGGTLTDTLTDGAGFVGGNMLKGVDLAAKTALMGTELLGEGINLLLGEDDASAFFHEEPEKLEGYDTDYNLDEMLPDRFQDPEKEKEVRASMKVEWDEYSFSEMDGDPKDFIPPVVVDKTVSQRKLEIKEEQERPKKEDSDDEATVETAHTVDIYFTDAEIRAKAKAEKRERKRLKKERKLMTKLERRESKLRESEAQRKEEEDDDGAYDPLGVSFKQNFSLLSNNKDAENTTAAGNQDGNPVAPSDDAKETDEASPPPIRSLEIPGRQLSANMDSIEKKVESKRLWGKLKGHVTQRVIVKAFENTVKQKNDFFHAFDDELDAIDELGDDPMGAAAVMLNNEHDTEKDKVEKLRKQLDDYEANLEKERKEVEEERKRIAIEKTELERQFKFESERNAELTKQSDQLKKELDVELEKKNEAKLQRELEELRAENEVLQEQVSRHDTILRQLHRDKAIREKREKRKQMYGGDQPRRSSSATIQTFRSVGTIQFDDEATIVTYVAKSRRTSNIKAMEENLEEMNDELEARQKVIEMQVMELENLHKQLKDAEDRTGLKPLKDEFLEVQKGKEEIQQKALEEKAELTNTLKAKQEIAAKLAAEVSRLKLERTKKELKAAQEEEPPAEKGGLFSMLWGDTPPEETDDGELALSKLGL